MKRLLLVIALFCFTISVKGQRVYFMYLQSEKSAPFFVRLGEKIHSSTTTGYLILSSLKDSTYNFSIGYPANVLPEAKFSVVINGSDRGFLIKAFEDGPGLFDLQTLSVTKAMASVRGSSGQTVQRTDAFTKLLSQATDDASLLTAVVPAVVVTEAPKPKEEKPPVITEEKIVTTDVAVADVPMKIEKTVESRTDTALNMKDDLAVIPESGVKKEVSGIVPPADTVKVVGQPTIITKEPEVELKKEEPKEEVSKKEETKIEEVEPFKRSVITRRSESSTTEGFGLVFFDVLNGVTDTIRLLIPNPKKAFVTEEVKSAVEETPQQSTAENVLKENVPAITPKTSCAALATDKDFLRLRKNMAAETNDEEMIDEARKYFKNKCFTTEQIRNLSALFLTNASKYQFFDAAYNHVSDMDQFAALGSEIRDEYYTRRFKALIGQ